MRDVFVSTQNFQKFETLCNELLSSALGVEMAAVIGRAGRGKTSAAERIYTMNPNTVYALYREDAKPNELLREVTFRLCGVRPNRREVCFEKIREELSGRRRIIMVDEADRMPIKCMNVLRNIHDECRAPVLLIGEEDLVEKLGRERRLISRVRAVMKFEPISQADVAVFYKMALDVRLTPDNAAKLLKHSGGDFRRVLTGAVEAERLARASGMTDINDNIIERVCANGGANARHR